MMVSPSTYGVAMALKHEQLLLWEGGQSLLATDPDKPKPTDGQLDVSFLLNGFCIAGLPLRRPRDNTLVWKRQDEQFALTVQSSEIALPGGSSFVAGLPFGPKARLLAMWLATEAKDPTRRPDNRWIEIGKITDWLRAVGITPNGGPEALLLLQRSNSCGWPSLNLVWCSGAKMAFSHSSVKRL